MKRVLKTSLALVLALVFCLSLCVNVSAYTFAMTKTTGHNVKTGVAYAKYNVTSKVNGNTLACTTLTFNPASSGYIPMAFQGYAGTSGVLSTQYSIATNKYGYDVAGVINGAFFSMGTPYGTLVGLSISNGKIVGAHMGYSDQVVAFGSDGSMNIVGSTLKYTVGINGKSYPDMLYYINKTSGSASASNWSDRFYYFDTSCGTKCDSYAACPGTEILCKKVDNTDLAVGQTLVGEVVSVTKNTYGGSLGDSGVYSDNFILFMRSGSSYESYISGLKAGDTITINTEETIEASRSVMENANSVITNVGWLVKNGVDQTLIQSTIGTHSVTLQARWTAFGQKADGSYVFFTSEGGSTGSGGSLTLRDVAQAMINMGCTNVIRMDGGGSSAMYVSNTGSGSAGYVQSSSRAISDCILVVKRSSATNSTVKSNLLSKINAAESYAATASSTALTNAIANAKAVYNSSTAIMGDHKRAIMELREVANPEGVLQAALDNASSIAIGNYSDLALDRLDYAYLEAKRLISAGASDSELIAMANKIKTLAADTATKGNRISLGASYATHVANTSYPDTGLAEMTDGLLFGKTASSAEWTGYHINSAHGSITGKGSYTDIKVDLGEAKKITGFGVSALNYTPWGISVPTLVEVYASSNGTDYYFHSTLKQTMTPITGAYQTIPYESIASVASTDRYVVFRCYFASSHMFIGEVSVYGEGDIGRSNFVSFNKRIATDDAIIFTPSFGTINHTTANLTWAKNFLCTYSADKGAYVISSIIAPNGSTDYSYTLASGSIIIGLHGTASGGNASVVSAKVGDLIHLTGIDVTNGIAYPGARISVKSEVTDVPTYQTPNISVVDSTATVDGDYIMLPGASMDTAAITGIFTDKRITVSGVGTGATVKNNATGATYTLYVMGDINGDNIISAADIVTMKVVIKNNSTMQGAYLKASDFDGDSTISTTDYVSIKKNLVNE